LCYWYCESFGIGVTNPEIPECSTPRG
jgi:hypothetical protein